MSHDAALPERTLLALMRLGVQAITDDLATNPAIGESALELILKELEDDTERGKAREVWTDNPPEVVQGFPRVDSPFPLYAVTLGSDLPNQDYLSLGDQAFLNELEQTAGSEFKQRVAGTFVIFVMSEHPDITTWYYRVLRHIFNIGVPYLVARGLTNPKLTGADLAPDPQYTPDNLFTRRLTISVEYNESWTDRDPLWATINGTPEAFITDPDQIDVRHVDSEPFPGGVVPIEE